MATSLNGGDRFSTVAVPGISECTGNSAYELATHPEASFDADGRAYLISSVGAEALPGASSAVCGEIGCGLVPNTAILVNHFEDGGRTWSDPPALVYVEAKFPAVIVQDAHVAADPQRAGTAYATWTELDALANSPVCL